MTHRSRIYRLTLWLQVMMLACLGILSVPLSQGENKSVDVKPGSVVFVNFQTTMAGEDHTLTINNVNPDCDIEISAIVAQDQADKVLWKRTNKTADTHVYKLAGARVDEPLWIHIHGIFKCGGGGGGGAVAGKKPEFDVIVPFVELSVDGDNETGDALAGGVPDGVGNYLPGEEGTTKKLTESGFKPQKMRLIASPVDGQIVDKVTFTIESVTSLSGYCVDATDSQVQGANKDDDFSFKEDVDDLTEDHSAIVNRHAVVDIFCKDYGGKCVVRADFKKGSQVKATAKIQIPIDTDGDGLADKWEKEKVQEWNTQYGVSEPITTGFFTAIDDKELRDPDGSGALAQHKDAGDGLTALQEYRGFDFKSVSGWGAENGHTRLSPARKELLVEVDRSVDGGTVAATRPEVIDAMSKAKAAFINSAGVRLCYVVDNIVSDNASFSTDAEQEAYVNANYDTTSDVDRSEYVYLLFGFKVVRDTSEIAGVSSTTYHGGLLGCNFIRNDKSVGRFRTLYNISFEQALGQTATHELGHSVACVGDYQLVHNIPGGYIRKVPAYAPSQITLWQILDEEAEENAKLLTGNPVQVDFKRDLYANDSVTVSEIMQGIDGIADKYEAIAENEHLGKHAWLLKGGNFIWNHPDGSDPHTWTSISVFKDISTVMTYNPSIQKFLNIQFNNDHLTEPAAYNREVGSMDVKNNYSKTNYP